MCQSEPQDHKRRGGGEGGGGGEGRGGGGGGRGEGEGYLRETWGLERQVYYHMVCKGILY